MTTQIVLASTAFGLATVSAAYDSGAFDHCERRILVIVCNTAMPEATAPMHEIAGAPDLMRRFDAVYDYNACIEPQHPSIWRPRLGDLPIWERHFRWVWDLGTDDLQLVWRASTSTRHKHSGIFGDARIDVYADGLMSYGPTRTHAGNGRLRIERRCIRSCARLDARCCSASGTCPRPLFPARASVRWSRAWSPTARITNNDRVALIVGQYLSAGGS